MLATSRLIQIASLISLIAAGCGGSSGPQVNLQPDAAGADSGATGQGDDGAVGTTPDGSVGANEAGGCPAGYQASSGGGCVDIDECAQPGVGACDAHATCTNTVGSFTCACKTPYTGDGKSCTCVAGTPGCAAANGSTCGGDADCQNGHCVGGTCCASACTSPASCQTAAGATCGGGTTCIYPTAADNTACDDGDACTKTDVCTAGTCVGAGAVSCDDGNPCTTDTCVAATGCAHDGTGVTTANCQPGDLCTIYRCDGDKGGTCDPRPAVDCSGSKDACNAGVCDPTNGTCSKKAANEGGACEDGNACTTGDTCHSGTCMAVASLVCNDGNPCTDDSCDPVLGCKTQNNAASCNDGNPCTVGDTCAGGLCQKSSPMDCSGQSDACNVGVCNGGTCGKSAKADNTACDDGKTCTTTDVCTSGACTGSGNSCGANSSACAEGTPRVCTCTNSFVSSGGQCVPPTNECAAAPCVAVATCNDPSSAVGDFVCTCPTGYTGNGKTAGTGCTAVDNCAGNPCGTLGTCVNGINSHTCTCNAGSVSVNGVCVCDMNGTFALQDTFATTWSGINLFENGTNVSSKTWALRTQTYDSTGQLVIKTTQCGGTTFDLCGEGVPIVGDEAYAQYFPTPIYGQPAMPVGSLSITIANALPGKTYQEPQTASLLGISLADPLGAWPAASANIGTGPSQTNGAIWVDNDNDLLIGVTSYAVPPGGISHTTAPHPFQDYGAKSTQCPRRDATLPRLSYNYLLGAEGLNVRRVKRLYTGQRVVSSMSGTITSCDLNGATLIQGTLGGPDNGQVHIDARVGGCVRVNDAGTGEINCSSQLASLYDGQGQTEHITSSSFILKRVASTATCADVRGMTFP